MNYSDSQSIDSVNQIKRILTKNCHKKGILEWKKGHSFWKFYWPIFSFFFIFFLSPWHYIGKQETKTSTMNWWNFGQKVIQRAKGAALLHAILSPGTYCDLLEQKIVSYAQKNFSPKYEFLKIKWSKAGFEMKNKNFLILVNVNILLNHCGCVEHWE